MAEKDEKMQHSGWDKKAYKATGYKYIYWIKPDEYPQKFDSGGEEFLPPKPQGQLSLY